MDFQDKPNRAERLLREAIARFKSRKAAGENVDRTKFLQEYSECASGLQRFFDSLAKEETISGANAQANKPIETNENLPRRSPATPGIGSDKRFPFRFGRYRVLSTLGSGGMGAVYLAFDTHLERQVALKTPLVDAARGTKAFKRFMHEAKININHPNICTVYDAAIFEGQPYISMAYIQGKSLSELLSPSKPFAQDVVAGLVTTIARAMHAAHSADVIHRDLKPGNIMVDLEGQPHVLDFGLSYRLGRSSGRLTSEGKVGGTLAYMSPEQLAGKEDGVGLATDIYSLGVTFYELVTGKLPFQGSLGDLLQQIQRGRPTPPSKLRPAIDPTIEAICLRMMAKRPCDRFESMKSVSDSLSNWLTEKSGGAENADELKMLGNRVRSLTYAGAGGFAGIGLLEMAELVNRKSAGANEVISDAAAGSDVSPGSQLNHDHWQSPLEAHLEEAVLTQSANPLFGNPEQDCRFWDGQQSYSDTCAIRCQEFILQQYTGADIPEEQLIAEAAQHGWYSPGQGTPTEAVGNLLELHGVEVSRYTDANIFHLASELGQGHKVIIGVDSSRLWNSNPRMNEILNSVHEHFGIAGRADHAVVVTGVDTTDPANVEVVISDPGDGSSVASYPMDQFLAAWAGSDFFMVATQEPAPAHLPEMQNFDYLTGHIDRIGSKTFQEFVDQQPHSHDPVDHHFEFFDKESDLGLQDHLEAGCADHEDSFASSPFDEPHEGPDCAGIDPLINDPGDLHDASGEVDERVSGLDDDTLF